MSADLGVVEEKKDEKKTSIIHAGAGLSIWI